MEIHARTKLDFATYIRILDPFQSDWTRALWESHLAFRKQAR